MILCECAWDLEQQLLPDFSIITNIAPTIETVFIIEIKFSYFLISWFKTKVLKIRPLIAKTRANLMLKNKNIVDINKNPF